MEIVLTERVGKDIFRIEKLVRKQGTHEESEDIILTKNGKRITFKEIIKEAAE